MRDVFLRANLNLFSAICSHSHHLKPSVLCRFRQPVGCSLQSRGEDADVTGCKATCSYTLPQRLLLKMQHLSKYIGSGATCTGFCGQWDGITCSQRPALPLRSVFSFLLLRVRATPQGWLSISLAKPLLITWWKLQYRSASNPTLLSVLFNDKTINQGERQYYILFTFY